MASRVTYTFCVDENLPHYLARHLARLYNRHTFLPVKTLELLGSDDVALFQRLQGQKFDAIITTDVPQIHLNNPSERSALRDAGIHWIGTRNEEGIGRGRLGRLCATIEAGLGEVLGNWKSVPSVYWIDAVKPHVRTPYTI